MEFDIDFKGDAINGGGDPGIRETLREACRERLNKVLTLLAARYPPEMGFSVDVYEDRSIDIEAYTCEDWTHFDISGALTYMPTVRLLNMLDTTMTLAHDEGEGNRASLLPNECLDWIYRWAWTVADRTEEPYGGIAKMEPSLRTAIRNLKEAGLLDGMPKGVTFVRKGYLANVVKRQVWIPEDLHSLDLPSDAPIQTIMGTVYKRCFIDHIVSKAVYNDEFDVEMDVLRNEMMDYAVAVAEGE